MTQETRILSPGKDSLFNKWSQENWTVTLKKKKKKKHTGIVSNILKKKKKQPSKWIKELSVRPET